METSWTGLLDVSDVLREMLLYSGLAVCDVETWFTFLAAEQKWDLIKVGHVTNKVTLGQTERWRSVVAFEISNFGIYKQTEMRPWNTTREQSYWIVWKE